MHVCRPLSRSAKRLTLIIVALLLIITLAGCGGGGDATSSDPNILSDADATAAYSATTQGLTLPPKATWPPLKLKDDKYRLAYRQVDVVSVAENSWLCSWQREWVSDFGKNKKRSAAALAQLRTFPSMAEYQQMYDASTRSAFDARLVEAGLGDPTSMRQDVKINC